MKTKLRQMNNVYYPDAFLRPYDVTPSPTPTHRWRSSGVVARKTAGRRLEHTIFLIAEPMGSSVNSTKPRAYFCWEGQAGCWSMTRCCWSMTPVVPVPWAPPTEEDLVLSISETGCVASASASPGVASEVSAVSSPNKFGSGGGASLHFKRQSLTNNENFFFSSENK